MSDRRSNLVLGAMVMALFGLIAAALAIGAQYGDRRGSERTQRFSATWLASTEAAVSITTTAIAASLGAAPAPAPPVRYHKEYRLVKFAETWAFNEYRVGSDGSRRFLCQFGSDWNPAGAAWFADVLAGVSGETEEATAPPQPTPEEKKKELLEAGIVSCCGTKEECANFCGCKIVVHTTPAGQVQGTESWCKCADEEPNDECPANWPPETA